MVANRQRLLLQSKDVTIGRTVPPFVSPTRLDHTEQERNDAARAYPLVYKKRFIPQMLNGPQLSTPLLHLNQTYLICLEC